MNKKLLIGIGVAAVAGIAYYMYSRGGSSSSSDISSPNDVMDKSNTNAPSETKSDVDKKIKGGEEQVTEVIDSVTAITQSGKEGRQARRQVRRDCKAEANSRGLKGKARRQFKRECKAQGGFDSEESSDFAFNGHQLDVA